ncbi:hypothetical protein OHS18_38380 [Amycolatopsis sp. NBC_00355]|uniref:hypothetical protein n=1 Tax=Amycolatopsis sp. NBC_00355 TaxID=2975957 RepID=UPI002E25DAE5
MVNVDVAAGEQSVSDTVATKNNDGRIIIPELLPDAFRQGEDATLRRYSRVFLAKFYLLVF